jgi:hypothetical protein
MAFRVSSDWVARAAALEIKPAGEALQHWPVMPLDTTDMIVLYSGGRTGVEEQGQKLCRTIGEMAWRIGTRQLALLGCARLRFAQ